MKKLLVLLLVFFLVSACAETYPAGKTFDAYRPVWDREYTRKWDTEAYIAAEGLLFLSMSEEAEISAAIEEKTDAETYVNGIARHSEIIRRSEVLSDEYGQHVAFSYVSPRGDAFEVKVCVKDAGDMSLLLIQRTWGEDAENAGIAFEDIFVPSFSLEKVKTGPQYLALLTACFEDESGIMLSLDFVNAEFDAFMGVVFINEEIKSLTYMLKEDALIYMPNMGGTIYNAREVKADAETIAWIINEYRGINGQDAAYLVQFDENNDIIRLQHYNVL